MNKRSLLLVLLIALALLASNPSPRLALLAEEYEPGPRGRGGPTGIDSPQLGDTVNAIVTSRP